MFPPLSSCYPQSAYPYLQLPTLQITSQVPYYSQPVPYGAPIQYVYVYVPYPAPALTAGSANCFEGIRGAGERSGPEGYGGPGRGFGGAVGGGRARNDAQSQEVVNANAAKFEQYVYEDEQTGKTLEYSLYVPEGIGSGDKLPLVMYMPDLTGSNIGAEAIVRQYFGANVWVTDEFQQKHPSFVLVPAFMGMATSDSWQVSDEVDMTIRLIENLESRYTIDEARIYTTGQSMGCMASLYLNSKHPDFFAASIYVSGQWDISVLKVLEAQKFFYIVAGGDKKASTGQDEVMAMFDADGVPYSFGEWDAQDDQAAQDAAAEALIAEGLSANMVRFETGTVLKGQGRMEHMASFNHAYKLGPIRDWLFDQSNDG